MLTEALHSIFTCVPLKGLITHIQLSPLVIMMSVLPHRDLRGQEPTFNPSLSKYDYMAQDCTVTQRTHREGITL